MKKLILVSLLSSSACFNIYGQHKTEKDLSSIVALEQVTTDLSSMELDKVWQSMPSSYQQELEDLIKGRLQNADQELYSKVHASLTKLTSLVKNKEAEIVSILQKNAKSPVKQKRVAVLAQDWSSIVDVLEFLITSDLSAVEKVASFEASSFLQELGYKLKKIDSLSPCLSECAEMKYELISSKGDMAKIKATANSGKNHEEEMTKVEGKWIPVKLSENWQELTSNLKTIKKLNSAQKQGVLGLLNSIDSLVDKAESSSGSDGLAQVFQEGSMGLVMQFMMVANSFKQSEGANSF